jgi:hypothetical protein
MDHSLREALNIGLVRQNQKNIGDMLFKNLRDKANNNTFKSAELNKTSGRNFGIADYNTGLITVPNSFPAAMAEIEKVETRENIVNTLTSGTKKDLSKIIDEDARFYSNSWFDIKGNQNRSPSWNRAIRKHSTIDTTLPSGKNVKGILFGNQETGLSVLFRIDKVKELN